MACGRLIVLLAIIGFAIVQRPVSSLPAHADTVSSEQQQLQKILAGRHYWVKQLKEQQYKESQAQKQLSSTKWRLGQQQDRLANEQARFAAQRAQLLTAITEDQDRVDSVRSQLQSTRGEYTSVHHQAAGLLLRLKQLKAEIHRQLRNVGTALVQMYDLSQVSPLESVLEAHSLTDLLNQQNFVDQIGAHDNAILGRARREHAAVYSVAKVYIDKMAELRALQAQEKDELKTVVVQTQHEDVLLIEAQSLTQRRQQGIQKQEAAISGLAQQEDQQLNDIATSAQSSAQMIQADQNAAEKVAIIIGESTGIYPYVGGIHNPAVADPRNHHPKLRSKPLRLRASAQLSRDLLSPLPYRSRHCRAFRYSDPRGRSGQGDLRRPDGSRPASRLLRSLRHHPAHRAPLDALRPHGSGAGTGRPRWRACGCRSDHRL